MFFSCGETSESKIRSGRAIRNRASAPSRINLIGGKHNMGMEN